VSKRRGAPQKGGVPQKKAGFPRKSREGARKRCPRSAPRGKRGRPRGEDRDAAGARGRRKGGARVTHRSPWPMGDAGAGALGGRGVTARGACNTRAAAGPLRALVSRCGSAAGRPKAPCAVAVRKRCPNCACRTANFETVRSRRKNRVLSNRHFSPSALGSCSPALLMERPSLRSTQWCAYIGKSLKSNPNGFESSDPRRKKAW